jgi:hypothetical protein
MVIAKFIRTRSYDSSDFQLIIIVLCVGIY